LRAFARFVRMAHVADVANAESQQEWYRMSISFRLPTQFTLADVDLPEIEYEDDCVTIHGIVSPSGQCGFSKEHGQYDVHMFTIAAWRDAQGNLIERELLVLRPVASGHDWGRDYPAFSTHRISVVLTKDGTRAVFNEALPPSPSDREFVSIIERLRQPVIVSTARFGELVLDRRIGWFEGEAEWNGTRIEVTFLADDEGSIDDALMTAESLWTDQGKWKDRIDSYAVQELLSLKNEAWLDDDEPTITAEEFVARMTLSSITVRAGGEFEFWYDDGDLFLGHSIQVCGNLRDGPNDADIPG
jgi:hypothetical protein